MPESMKVTRNDESTFEKSGVSSLIMDDGHEGHVDQTALRGALLQGIGGPQDKFGAR
jgi:hypothetical protein